RHVRPVFRGSMAAAFLVVAQAVLGGVVVKGDLRAALVTAHFATAMLLVGALVYTTTSVFCHEKLPQGEGRALSPDRSFARLAMVTAAATYALLLVGAYVRGQNAGLAFADWPLMNGKLVPQLGGVFTTMFLHRVLAAVVALLVLYTAIRSWTMAQRSRDFVAFSSLALALFV